MGSVEDANVWWHGLTPGRRIQIHHWVEPDATGHAETPGQQALFGTSKPVSRPTRKRGVK